MVEVESKPADRKRGFILTTTAKFVAEWVREMRASGPAGNECALGRKTCKKGTFWLTVLSYRVVEMSGVIQGTATSTPFVWQVFWGFGVCD